MEYPEAAVEVEVKASLMERCCRGGGRGETDDFGPFQAPYVPQEVGRVTLSLLPRIVVKRVKSLWES